eukprot:SAG31_NODE_35606_length_321_cov_1.144144_1_plen_27_part_10
MAMRFAGASAARTLVANVVRPRFALEI